ncbi:sec-independent protein translocase protein TatB [Actinocorallia herbida]|uniref:Sec-independent protein translocase protein TatB n=1 Tax=Actinocorallia herbida TaxID=58109 RepID=A0A3N1CQT7_9ACTN|nr:sec-independent protein translocase protein TatB [Actinocorallia herbida]
MFDVGLPEALVLVVLALVIFGDKLPSYAQQAGRALRQLRQMAQSAQNDLKDGLGPEFQDFDPRDLNPKNFVRKHLFEGDNDPLGIKGLDLGLDLDDKSYASTASERRLGSDERPPFDSEAT